MKIQAIPNNTKKTKYKNTRNKTNTN